MTASRTAAATAAVPVATLLRCLAAKANILGLSLTAATAEVALVTAQAGYASPVHIAGGAMLTPDGLQELVQRHNVGGMVLGGSGLFRADGQTHYGARKLISGVAGVVYESDWLPTVAANQSRREHTFIWLCRAGNDDPCATVVDYIRRHTPLDWAHGARPSSARGPTTL